MEDLRMLIQTNQLDAAEAKAKEIIIIEPDNDLLYFYLGVLFEKKKNDIEAIKYYKLAFDKNPNNYTALFNWGIVNERLGNISSAKQAYEKVLQIKPDYSNAQNSLQRVSQSKPNETKTVEKKFDFGDLSYEWTPNNQCSYLYYFLSFVYAIPFATGFFALVNGNISAVFNSHGAPPFFGMISMPILFLGLFLMPNALTHLMSAIQLKKSKYAIYRNGIKLRIWEGFTVKNIVMSMYDIPADCSLKSPFPLSFNNDSYISIPDGMTTGQTPKPKDIKLFSGANQDEIHEIFEFIKRRSLEAKQEIGVFYR